MKNNNFKTHFPIFTTNQKLVYLDNAATTQIPQIVLDSTDDYYKKFKSNVHRGFYKLSQQATDAYENARAEVAKFINADNKEIIFTSGTTFDLNQLAYSLAPRLSHRDNVVLTRWEHHSNLVPWQQLAKHYGFEIRFIGLRNTSPSVISNPRRPSTNALGDPEQSRMGRRGEKSLSQSTNGQRSLVGREASLGMTVDLASAAKLIDANTKIVSFGLVSNVLGAIAPAKEIIKLAKKVRAVTIVDAAQAMAHILVDVKDLDCDFLCFSGHKMYGPTGIGVLYGKKIMLEEHLEPFLFGGEMVTSVTYDKAEWNEVPHKFEAGTPNIAGAIGLGAAVKFIKKIGWKKIQAHENGLTKKLMDGLSGAGAQIVGSPICHFESPVAGGEKSSSQPTRSLVGREASLGMTVGERIGVISHTAPPFPATAGSRLSGGDKDGAGGGQIGVVSFTLPGIHPHDIAEVLAKENICIRAGFHCAEPIHRHLGLNQGTVRASLGVYNTEEDIDKLIMGIKKVKKIFHK